MPLIEARSRGYWAIAFVAGTLLNVALFLVLPDLGRSEPVPPPPVIVVDFSQWQEPRKAALGPMPQSKNQPRVKPKPKPKPKLSKPVVQPDPKPAPEPRPVEPPSESSEPVLTDTDEPPPPSAPPAVVEQPEAMDEALPEPVPLFKLTNMPRYLHKEDPIYPPLMRSQNREGLVKLEVLIDARGRVRDIRVLKSAGEAFDQAAINAIHASSFAPGNVNGKPVTVLMRVPVRFKLR